MLKIILKVVYVGIISSRTDTRNPISGKSNKAILHFFLPTDLKKSSSMANKKKKKPCLGPYTKDVTLPLLPLVNIIYVGKL